MEGLLGYNSAQVVAFGTTLSNVAKRTDELIIEKLTSGLVTPMSTIWYTPNGVEFFASVQKTFKDIAPKIQEVLEGFRKTVENAAVAWAQSTGGDATVTVQSLPTIALDLNVTSIKSDIGGNMGINVERANAVAAALPTVEADIKTSLNALALTLTADSSFLGNAQASKVNACFTEIYDVVGQAFKVLTEGETSVSEVIKTTAKNYTTLSDSVESAF